MSLINKNKVAYNGLISITSNLIQTVFASYVTEAWAGIPSRGTVT